MSWELGDEICPPPSLSRLLLLCPLGAPRSGDTMHQKCVDPDAAAACNVLEEFNNLQGSLDSTDTGPLRVNVNNQGKVEIAAGGGWNPSE